MAEWARGQLNGAKSHGRAFHAWRGNKALCGLTSGPALHGRRKKPTRVCKTCERKFTEIAIGVLVGELLPDSALPSANKGKGDKTQ